MGTVLGVSYDSNSKIQNVNFADCGISVYCKPGECISLVVGIMESGTISNCRIKYNSGFDADGATKYSISHIYDRHNRKVKTTILSHFSSIIKIMEDIW